MPSKNCFALTLCLLLTSCGSEPTRAPAASVSGETLYLQLCASCHGRSGVGDGPVAASLKEKVPDLTRIAWRDGGEFPREDVKRSIDGRVERLAHGPREMPVWGIRFYDLSNPDRNSEQARVEAMIDKLVEQIEKMQRDSDGVMK